MLFGVVKSFRADKGWGFIIPDEGEGDIFVHARTLGGMSLERGQRVGFNVKTTQKGKRAINVIVLLGEPPADSSTKR